MLSLHCMTRDVNTLSLSDIQKDKVHQLCKENTALHDCQKLNAKRFMADIYIVHAKWPAQCQHVLTRPSKPIGHQANLIFQHTVI